MRTLPDTLIPIRMAVEREERRTPDYSWRCDNRGPNSQLILQWTIEGWGMFCDGNQWTRVGPESVFLAKVPGPASYLYPAEGKQPWVFRWVTLLGSLATELFGSLIAAYGSVLPLPSHSVPGVLLLRLIRSSARNAPVDAFQASQQVYQFYTEWLRQLAGPEQGRGDLVGEVIRLCGKDWQRSMAVKELAHEFGISREHFTRLFLAQTGMAPGEFLRGLRVREAMGMLRRSGVTIAEVARRCGFRSAAHMQKVFVRHTGRPPGHYRIDEGE